MTNIKNVERDVLPTDIKPVNYAISIYDLELGGAFSFHGTVSITANILKSTNSITLNSKKLKLQEVKVQLEHTKTQQTLVSKSIIYDAPKERVTIGFPEDLPVSDNAVIIIKFQGTINNDMAGFYRSQYKPTVPAAASVPRDDEFHYMFSTQFESSDARMAFPCFDEPNLKATFDFEIELPEDQVALSNMPEKSVRKGKDGLKTISFERTPIMSTYLLAWAIGDFTYVEEFTERKYNGRHMPVRVYTTKGLETQGNFALEHAHKIIDYFSEIFDIDYPLPKYDLLAVHEFSHGAMENWGLVTYRTTTVLFDEKTSDARFKNKIAYVVSHESAHMWFGNLVTMDWWSELWLNEGFATFIGWAAVDYLHPDWEVWPQFVNDGMQTAFALDAMRSSHPIEVPVKDALEVDQIFDAISYLKGSSIIRMLATYLGMKTFLEGVSNYLKEHAYGNATTNDLWSALSKVSGKNIEAMMDVWIRQIGYPVITVAEEPGQISLRQSRYLSTGDVKSVDDETTWWVPLGLKGESFEQKGAVAKDASSIIFNLKEDTIREISDSFYKINTDNASFFRTNYPPARLAQFGKHIELLSTSDKIGLIGDAGALALSGDAATPALLAFLEGFSTEENYLVWSQIIDSLATIKSVFGEEKEIAAALQSFTLKLTKNIVAKIGWNFSPDENYLTGQLRALLIRTAGLNGDKEIIAEAQRQFYAYTTGKSDAIHPSLRSAVFQIAIKNGGQPAYNALRHEWETTSSIDGKELTVRALGYIQDKDTLLPDYLTFLMTLVPVQDAHTGAAALAANSKTRMGFWNYIKENFEAINVRLGTNKMVIDRFLKVSLQKFTDLEIEQEIATFFKGRDNSGYERTLAIVSDTIKVRAGYRNRDGKIILEWLKVHGYA